MKYKLRLHKNTIATTLGSMLEYFDFAVYGLMSSYLAEIFFSSQSLKQSTIYAVIIFALGHIARPLGGVISGIIGDLYGRKTVFLSLTGVMSLSTLFIGLLPLFKNFEVISSVILMILRLLQGASFGGEIAGAVTIVGESSCKRDRTVNTSFIISGTSLGAILATGTLFILTKYLSRSEILRWGWRIPFIIGGIMGLILWLYRKNVSETVEFINAKREGVASFFKMLIKNKKSIILSSLISLFTSSLLVTNIFFPKIINEYFEIEYSEIYKSTTISLIVGCGFSPIIGYLLKNNSKYRVIILTHLIYILSSTVLFCLLENCNFFYLLFFMVLNQIFIAICYNCQLAIQYDLFPTQIRYTGIAFSANLISALASFMPLLLSELKVIYSDASLVPCVLLVTSAVSLCSTLLCVNHTKRLKSDNI